MSFIITEEEWKTVLHLGHFEKKDYLKINRITDNLYRRQIDLEKDEDRQKMMFKDILGNPDFLEIL